MAKQCTCNIEELKQMFGSEIDIKTFAKIANLLKTEGSEKLEAIKKKNAKKPAEKTWKLVLEKYPDFVIEKTTPKTSKQMVFMVSQNSYYIKDNVGQTVEELTADAYVKFTDGMPIIDMSDNFWIDQVSRGKDGYNSIMRYMNFPEIVEIIKLKLLTQRELCTAYNLQKIAAHYKQNAILVKKFAKNNKIKDYLLTGDTDFIQDMISSFGLENTIDYLKELSISLFGNDKSKIEYLFPTKYGKFYPDPTMKKSYSCKPAIKMEYKAFKEYTLYWSVRMGYANNPSNFWQLWDDDIRLQYQFYGSIKDKYPKDLPLHHNVLAYKMAMKQIVVDREKFDAQAAITKLFEKKIDKYVFLAPKTKDDFIDEATQQSNCLAGYVNKYTEGNTHIVFMRQVDSPETSLVTIEYYNGRIFQKYQAMNRSCTKEQNEVIAKWLEFVLKKDPMLKKQKGAKNEQTNG